MLARATLLTNGFKKRYELRGSSLQQSPTRLQLLRPTKMHLALLPSQSKSPPTFIAVLSEWEISSNEQHKRENSDSPGEDTKDTTSNNTFKSSDTLIDVEQDQCVYDFLDEWAKGLEHSTEQASPVDKTSKMADKIGASTLVEIDMQTPDAY